MRPAGREKWPELALAQVFARGFVLPVNFRLLLPGGDILPVHEVLRSLPANRLTARVSWQGGMALLKLFASARDCARELQGLCRLQEAELPTPQLLVHWPRALLAEWHATATSLGEALRGEPDAQQRAVLLRQALALIARLHRAGLRQRDMHLGNFLLSGTDLLLLDGAGIGRPLAPWRTVARQTDLARFVCQFGLREHAALYQALPAYAQGATVDQNLLLRVLRRRADALARKACRECGEFVAERGWSSRIVLRRDLDGPVLRALLSDPDSAITTGQVLKRGNSASVVRVGELVIKRYNRKGVWHTLGHCWRDSRAWRCWGNAARLRAIGMNTPLPVAVLEQRWGPLVICSYHVSEFVDAPALQSLAGSAQPLLPAWLDPELRLLFAALELGGLSHGDCKASNFLLAGQQLTLLDLDSMRRQRGSWGLRRALHRDRLRFVANWQGGLQAHFARLLGVDAK